MKKWHVGLSVAAIAAVALGGIVLPSTASAHARLKTSTPAVGEVVQTSPSEVVIFLTEDAQKVSGTYGITVTKDRGPDVTAGPTVLDDNDRSKMSVPLQPDLPPGRYVVEYKDVSDADGDPFNGAFSFYIQTQPTAVDRANDAQLAQIGAEEGTPGADTTPGTSTTATGGTTPSAATTATTTTPATGATAVATSSASSTTDSGGSNTGRNIAIAAAIVVALAVIAGGAWYAFGRPRQ